MSLTHVEYRVAATRVRAWPAVVPVLTITGLALVLRFWAFSRIPSDPFYDAAVRSMGLSWRNLFYGAFDPGGTLSIDKPPIDLWLQVLSTKLFGFSSVSVRLPEAIAGTLAVPLLYDLLRRGHSRRAGLAAAAALAVLPAAVMTSRSDTMDTLCGTVLVAAAWALVALPPRRGVLAAAALAGLAFEIKLFQAAVAFPALLVIAYLRRAPLRPALPVFVATAAGWPLLASLLPGAHPWPLGSTNGQLWNVILVYNGLWRLGSATGSTAPVGPSPWRLFTPEYLPLIGFPLLVLFGAALLASRGQVSRTPLVAGLTVWVACGFVLFSVQGWVRIRYFEAFTPALAGALGIALTSLPRSRLLLIAVLAWPLWTSVEIARSGRYDSQTLGAQPAAWVDRLHPYAGHLAVSSAVLAGPLIVREGQPVTILTSWKGRPFTTVDQLRAAIADRRVRYALLDPARDAPSVRWALAHGTDITARAGVGPWLRLVRLAP